MKRYDLNKEFRLAIPYILTDNADGIEDFLKDKPQLVDFETIEDFFLGNGVVHQFYTGDSLLHVASAGHKSHVVKKLLELKFYPNLNASKRIATPLHYASDGDIGKIDENTQVKTIELLIKKGADLNAPDANGATPLHRAVRCRCFGAVKSLIEHGCLISPRNKSGSTPLRLATVNSGRGGSGSIQAKENQTLISNLLCQYGGK